MHIGQTNPSYSDPLLEAVDIRQIYDKFPEKKGGLKELYERGPQNSFFLVKFWVRSRFRAWVWALPAFRSWRGSREAPGADVPVPKGALAPDSSPRVLPSPPRRI